MLKLIAIFFLIQSTTFAQSKPQSESPPLREATQAEQEAILKVLGEQNLKKIGEEALDRQEHLKNGMLGTHTVKNKQPTTTPMRVMVPQNFNPEEVERDGKPFFQQIFVSWGFDRCTHSISDLAFTTPDGNFIIKNAVAKDRQSPFNLKLYLFSTVPQYNIDIGVMFNSKWGMELNINHMKWVFDNKQPYDIEGNYNHDVVLADGSVAPFEAAKAKRDASWVDAEHSDGYNYESISAVRNFNILHTAKDRVALDARVAAGIGFMMPKTKIKFHQDAVGNYVGADNDFHIAGPGAHADIKARLVFFSKFYLQGTTRASIAKLNDVLVDGSSSRLEQLQPVTSIQLIGQIGYIYNFKKKKPTNSINSAPF
jgi:hypothetical protein